MLGPTIFYIQYYLKIQPLVELTAELDTLSGSGLHWQQGRQRDTCIVSHIFLPAASFSEALKGHLRDGVVPACPGPAKQSGSTDNGTVPSMVLLC